MDRRSLVAVAALSAVLGVVAMAWLSPDTSSPLPAPAPPPAPAPVVAAVPRPPPAPTPPPVVVAAPRPTLPPPVREVEPGDFGPLDQLYEPDPQGLTTATFARRDRLANCWRDHGGLELGGRFTIHVTVEDGGDETGLVEADVVNPDAPQEMVDCVSDAMSDANFPSPGEGPISMIVPIPIPQ